MKVAIASNKTSVETFVGGRLERVKWFIILDLETNAFSFERNIQEADFNNTIQKLLKLGVEAIITDGYGPKTLKSLSENGLKLYSVSSMSVIDAVEKLKKNRLKESQMIGI